MKPRAILIDTDMGCDDIIAICMMLLSDEVSVEGITVVDGVAHLEQGVQNLLRVLELAGRAEIPVAIGASRPLAGQAQFPSSDRNEADNLPFLLDILPLTFKAAPIASSAVEFLHSRIMQRPGELTIVCLGPLTNIAQLLKKHDLPSPHSFNQIVIMGGAVYAPGNVPLRSNPEIKVAEYNLYIDPVSAHHVLNSGEKIILVGTDVTSLVPTEYCLERIATITPSRPEAKVIEIITKNVSTMDYFYDPLTAGIVIDPSIVIASRRLSLRVITDAEDETAGQTVPIEPGETEVVMDVDASRFYDLLLKLMLRK